MKKQLVGMGEVAAMLGVQRRTVHQWRFRGVLPVADFELDTGPVWERATILRWAKRTKRRIVK